MATQFDPDVVRRVAATEEIDVETQAGPDAPAHHTTIWVVTDGDAVYVRSVRAARGRWYRELMAHPSGAVWLDGQRLPMRAVPASDPATVERVSAAYRQKYATSPYMQSMLAETVLPTTLRLDPS